MDRESLEGRVGVRLSPDRRAEAYDKTGQVPAGSVALRTSPIHISKQRR
jgi:hypothetical protein